MIPCKISFFKGLAWFGEKDVIFAARKSHPNPPSELSGQALKGRRSPASGF